MDFIRRSRNFFRHPLFSDYRTLFALWIALALISAILKSNNNFLIFRYVFWHTINELPLFASYPLEYWDVNHYGPFFSLVIAPFAVLPVRWGLTAWLVTLAASLYLAIRYLPIEKRGRIFILWFCAHELLTGLFMAQFNIAIGAIVVGAFILIERERDIWAAFLIMLGTFVKIYGIVGLAFFFFSRHRWRFALWLGVWAILFFVLPMLISSPEYVVSQYVAWWQELAVKNQQNLFATMQNVSLLGMVRKISGVATYSDLWIIAAGLILFALPYLRFSQYKHLPFKLFILSSVLLFVVLFSTGSESSSYIIALVGVGIWYIASPWRRSKWDIALVVFAFILTSLSPSDLFPAYLRREFVHPYALKALPCVLIWGKLTYELLTRNFSPIPKALPAMHTTGNSQQE